jgi:hypothetical protein
MGQTAHSHATHTDANGNPVVFAPDGTPYHPTPCCGGPASINDGPMFCKRCHGTVDELHGDVPVEPFTILDVADGHSSAPDSPQQLAEELVGLAAKPVPGMPKNLALTVDTRPDSQRRGFLAIADLDDPERRVYTSFSSIAGRDALDVASDALASCREMGATRCVDADGKDIAVADLIEGLIADHPRQRVLSNGIATLIAGNVYSTYRDLDGRLVRAQCMRFDFTLDDTLDGAEGDWIVREVGSTGPVELVKPERFEIEYTLETPGTDL